MRPSPFQPPVDIAAPDWADRVGRLALAPHPLVLLAGRPVRLETRTVLRCLDLLLRRDGPVFGVLGASLEGPAAALFLACDEIFWLPRKSLRFEPGPLGETVLLAMRLGAPAAARVWFSGGRLFRREAVESGWARAADGPPPRAVGDAERRTEGLSAEALRLLRPLLLREHGLPRGPAETLERASFALLFETGAPAEGARSFLEKRKPDFSKE